MMNDSDKGTYVLVISIGQETRINVGALGGIDFAKGRYAYVGSAQSGLKRRVERHFRKDKRKFWHIDYLLNDDHVKILEVFYKEAGKIEECKIAEKVGHKSFPVDGFGSSDCKCVSHLFKLKSYQILEELMRETSMQSEYLIKRAKKF
jgi:Uri superfamily endonuclease